MALLITTIDAIKQQTTEKGFNLFCLEQGIDPGNHVEPEEGICVDKMDLYRYGATELANDLSTSVANFKRDIGLAP